MGKLGRTLVTTFVAMVVITAFVVISQPSILPKNPYYGIISGIWILGIIGVYLWLGILSESPRIKVTFGGGNRPGKEGVDDPYHVGGAIFGFVAIISNTGGKKLNLEPKMILRDKKNQRKIFESSLMPRLPVPETRVLESKVGEHVGKSPEYCPDLLVLEPDETKKHRLMFFVEKEFIDVIGVDEHDTVKVYSAEYNLKFVDKGLGIAFECVDKGRNKFESKRSRLH
ncbi:MAG: hypothetical protein Q8O43_04780 [Dehalococcoidia bacterium]|nr:hypothetical protein [Dehalococcoidia bacterium]